MNDRNLILATLAALVAIWWFARGAPKSATSSPGCGCSGSCSASCGAGNDYQWNPTAPVNPTTATSTSLLSSPLTTSPAATGDLAGAAAPGSNARFGGSGANWQGLQTRRQSALTPPAVPNAPYSPTSNFVSIPYVNSARVSA
jgi:hypothetical protein